MKNTPNFVLSPGVIVEDLGSDSVVLIAGRSEVLTLSGEAADTLRQIRLGGNSDRADTAISELLRHGVIRPVDGVSRRSVFQAGLIGVGTGIATLAMPTAATAASSGNGGPNTTRFSVEWTSTSRNDITEIISAIFIALLDDGVAAALPPELEAVLTLNNGTELSGAFDAYGSGGNFEFKSLAVPFGEYVGLTHTLRFDLGSASYAVSYVGVL